MKKAKSEYIMLALGATVILAGAVCYILGSNQLVSVLIAVAGFLILALYFYYKIYQKVNPKRYTQMTLESADERGVQVGRGAQTISWYVGLCALVVLGVVSVYIKNKLIILIVGIALVVYGLSYFAAKAYYNRKM